MQVSRAQGEGTSGLVDDLSSLTSPRVARTEPTGAVALHPHYGNGEASCILILDSHEMNRRMLKAMLKPASYRIWECQKPTEAMEILERETIDVIVLDLMLPEMSGPDFCRWLKANRRTKVIPILMLTSVQGIENEIDGISSGAEEYLIKPIHPGVLRTRITAMLRLKALIDSLEEAETILFALASAVEYRDKNTGLHCERLASYSVLLGQALGVSPLESTALYRGGFLHDIGKICVPDAILFKRGKLTAAEWEVMRAHTTQGEAICRPMKSLAPVLPIIRSHHEKWDGTGYPDQLTGDQIPLLARILQTVDIYDALTSARPYKPAFTTKEAFRLMREEVEYGWRDPVITKVFIDLVGQQGPEKGICNMHASFSNMQVELSNSLDETGDSRK